MSQATKTRAAIFVLAAIIILAAIGVAASLRPQEQARAAGHPQVPAGSTCDSCKTAPLHTYQHAGEYANLACDRCHSTSSWTNVDYTHREAFLNESFHALIACARCHDSSGKVPDKACESCHLKRSPHPASVKNCSACHTAIAWSARKPIPQTHLSLLGGHLNLDCEACHTGFAGPTRPRGCVDCHGVHHGGLTKCEDCHDPARMWQPKEGFDHAAFFALKGTHADTQCAKCHPSGRFAGTPSTCVGCHGDKHGGLTDCSRCHSPKRYSWQPSFDHAAKFPLTGKHAYLDCRKCHASGSFGAAPTVCVGCHGPQHGGLTECASCHTTAGFKPATFKHSSVFVLTGAHATLACSKCHPSNAYATAIGQPYVCSSCHALRHGPDYARCGVCHTTTAFVSVKSTVVHPEPIQLGDTHRAMRCNLCHPTLIFEDPTTPCVTCHATTVPHVGPSDCLRCHMPTTWDDIRFVHPSISAHVLEGPDPAASDCTLCHPGRDFTTYTCDACHAPGSVTFGFASRHTR